MHWDEKITYQRELIKTYESALHHLKELKLTYPCSCTRKELTSRLKALDANTYDGYCLTHPVTNLPTAIRIKFHTKLISFEDKVQGSVNKQFKQQQDDIIILRKDNIFSYQLAVCVDDAEQEITEVLRGCDLLNETAGQIYIQQLLDLTTPNYAHIPVIVDHNGNKLSKQTFAEDISRLPVETTLFKILTLLSLDPPKSLVSSNKFDILKWAIEHWTIKGLAKEKISQRRIQAYG